jgi:hypothetical protein
MDPEMRGQLGDGQYVFSGCHRNAHGKFLASPLTNCIAQCLTQTRLPASNRANVKSILTSLACQASPILAKVRQVALWLARDRQKNLKPPHGDLRWNTKRLKSKTTARWHG